MGPKLFNIFISDLVYTITQCRIISYLDDTNIHCSNKNVRAVVKDNLKSDLGNATAWFIQNGMKSNLQKSRGHTASNRWYSPDFSVSCRRLFA